jgi:hypothetical protein
VHHSKLDWRMTGLGHDRSFGDVCSMSGLPPKADLHVGLADKIVSGREPAEVGYGLQVPDDDAWLHACRHLFTITIFNADCRDPNQRRLKPCSP